ncbi:RES family NAD+ phosphorylase [Thiomicrospira sp. R3]|uniref:RES family NAD+ phosphorylase n=1 Tax=Thiomicrospira sp. R3 TaxID=3035472 RepID=UPI00259BE067|nr:RES family NAD+ phosphorylase [Thiomicrospira sp. R3]WFE69147.1 RES family NAD+ phosphorylase [Thiomicrospira sp. R3]
MLVYRLIKEKYLSNPLSAEGATKVGGRWNAEGTPMLYTSANAATAKLEILAGVNEYATLAEFKLICIEIPDDNLYMMSVDELVNAQKTMESTLAWDADIRPEFTVDLGETWFSSMEILALGVPSTLSAHDYNILINTTHPDFKKVKVHRVTNEGMSQRLAIRQEPIGL